MFCSNVNDDLQSCEKNSVILAPYREYFKDMGLKLYLSGHLHVYERTKPICPNNSYLSMSVPYSMDCPVYIVEGVGGNNDYVQTEKECKNILT